MKARQLLAESQKHRMRKFVQKPLTEVFADPALFEQLIRSFPVQAMLGPELQKLQEATVLDKNFEMSPEEIEYIFRYIDQNNAGRNLAGKAVDKANQIRGTLRSIDKKILSLLSTKTAVQVEGFDNFMDQAEAKLRETDPEGKTSAWLQKYRAFAQKHPLSQAAITVIIAIVMALATGGIAWWAPAVGAFLLKGMFARLEGLNWKQSAYKGAKAATAAALLSWALQPGGGAEIPGATDVAADAGAGAAAADAGAGAADAASYTVAAGDTLSQIAQRFGTSVELIVQNNPSLQGINPDQISPGMVFKIPAELADVYANGVGTAADTVQKLQDGSLAVRWGNVPDAIQNAVAYGLKAKGVGESVEHLLPSLVLASNYSKVKFTESQVNQIFAAIDRMIITEAPAGYRVVPVDAVDRKFTDRAGRFITAKNTLGKLKSSWEVDDSESTAHAIQNFLQRRGVSDEMILRAFNAVYQKGDGDQEQDDQEQPPVTPPDPVPEPTPDPDPEPTPVITPEPTPQDPGKPQTQKRNLETRISQRLCSFALAAVASGSIPAWPAFKKSLVTALTDPAVVNDKISNTAKLGFTEEELEVLGGPQEVAAYIDRVAKKYRGKAPEVSQQVEENNDVANYKKKVVRAICNVGVTVIFGNHTGLSREQIVNVMLSRAKGKHAHTGERVKFSDEAIVKAIEKVLDARLKIYGKYLKK